MPTYDYECDSCGHAFELFQSINDAVKRKCPECAKPKLRRLFGTGAAVMFKGSGFYETDYRSDSYKKAAEADKKSAEPASGKESSTSDGKSSGEKSSGEKQTDDKSTGSANKTENSSGGAKSDAPKPKKDKS